VRVRLTRKLAEEIDGVNLSGRHVGDVLDLPPDEARLLMAENWALPDRRRHDGDGHVPAGHARRRDDRRPSRARGNRRLRR
jgi:hypothetical protein